MGHFFEHLKQRKLVQWALAYLAGAWVLLQVLGLAAESYDWPHIIMRLAFGLLALGLVTTLVLAWYHGERGEQKVSATELAILTVLLAVRGAEHRRRGGKSPQGRGDGSPRLRSSAWTHCLSNPATPRSAGDFAAHDALQNTALGASLLPTFGRLPKVGRSAEGRVKA